MKILWIFFGVVTYLDYFYGLFYKVKVKKGGYFFGLLKFKIFFMGT